MAQPVIINIPSLGEVEAKNAASEHTLAEILKIIKKFDKTLDGGKNAAGSAGGSGGAQDAAAGTQGGAGSSKLGKFSEAAGVAAKKMLVVGSAVAALGDFVTKTISQFANVGDSLEAAAGTLSFIPVLGGMFGAVASAAEKTTSAFQAAGSAGASFNGSVMEFSRAASSAGMTMADFGNFVKSNGQAMLGLGGTVEEGAKRFGAISKQVRNTSNDLFALGFSQKDLNQGIGNYTALLRQQGMQGTKSNSELANGARKYMKEMDALARITGEERSAKEAQMKQLASDAQFQAAMSGQTEEVRASFMNTVGGLPKGMQSFVKDLMATGTATTEENQKLLSMMGESGAMLQEFHAKQQRGEAITLEERNKLNNLMAVEGKQALDSIKQAGAANAELGPLVNSLASTYEINQDAVKKSTAEQVEAKKKTDALNAAVEKNRAVLAEFSNSFQMALANSGLLNDMMKAFDFVANLVMTFLVPAFNVIGMVLGGLASLVMTIIKPAFDAVGFVVGQILYPVFRNFAAFVQVDLLPPIQSFANSIRDFVSPAIEWFGGFMKDIVNPGIQSFSSFLKDVMVPAFYALVPVLAVLAANLAYNSAQVVLSTLAKAKETLVTGILTLKKSILAGATFLLGLPFMKVALVVGAVVAIFVALYRSGFTVESAMQALGDNLYRLYMTIGETIDRIMGFLGLGDKDARKARADERAVTRAELDAREKDRDTAREAKKQERGIAEQDSKRDAAAAKIDEKVLGIKGQQLDQAKEEQKVSKDYNNSLTLLKNEAQAQKSGLVKPPPSTAATPSPADIKSPQPAASAGAEAAKKGMEATAEAKAAEQAKQEAAKNAAQLPDASPTSTPDKPAVQESAESLLASLNNKMDQLIKINKGVATTGEKQLSAQEASIGDLFLGA